MNSTEISQSLKEIFGKDVQVAAEGSWQVETDKFRLLVLLSDDGSWLRILIPIVPVQEALPFLEQLMEANFDITQEARYGIYEDVLWGIFQHACKTLTVADFTGAVGRLVSLHERGLSDSFNDFLEQRIIQIIKAAKMNGQSLEATLQNLERFYQEGLMGDMAQSSEAREGTLAAWRYQLERLWSQVE
ncbi:MAG TPA: hypothetical protein V6D13_02270 [Halomicronema sp.]